MCNLGCTFTRSFNIPRILYAIDSVCSSSFLYYFCFFLYANDTKQKAKQAIGKIGFILLWGSILYVLITFIMNHCVISSIVPSCHDLFNFVFFNENPWAPHLWYLSAYIYVLFLILVIDKINLWELAFACIPFLLLVDLCFGKYSIVCWGHEFNWLYIRNFLFVGLPYVLIGALVRKYERIANKISGYLTLRGNFVFLDIICGTRDINLLWDECGS